MGRRAAIAFFRRAQAPCWTASIGAQAQRFQGRTCVLLGLFVLDRFTLQKR